MRKTAGHLLALLFLSGSIATGHAQTSAQTSETAATPDASIALELNNATDYDSVCRLSFMVRNGLDTAIDDMGLEIVLLSSEGLAQDFMMLRTGSLIAGKRRVRQFDLPDVSCGDIGEVLINDVADCQGEGLTASSCLGVLDLSTKTDIKFGL